MRAVLTCSLMLFLAGVARTQADSVYTYYDRLGQVCEPARAVRFSLTTREQDHFKMIMVDAADNKARSVGYFLDSACQIPDGPYREFHKNGRLSRAGNYYQGKKISVWKAWSDGGRLTDSAYYRDGYIQGLGLSWDNEGHVLDSLLFGAEGRGESHAYWPEGTPEHRGGYVAGKKQGTWTYYYHSGKKCQEVTYLADSAVSYTCFDESGAIQTKDCYLEQEAVFPGGDYAWVHYIGNRLSTANLPDDYHEGRIWGTVWIRFVVGTDGQVAEATVVTPVDPRLDQVALDIIRRSPRWKHAIQFNRPVKAYRLQPITFARATAN
ncbi:MAG TPA: energy transducer TonB [Chitinophagaceae bacterium]|nr:energy transducer TonB [Chitinophagaceae bacterium]